MVQMERCMESQQSIEFEIHGIFYEMCHPKNKSEETHGFDLGVRCGLVHFVL